MLNVATRWDAPPEPLVDDLRPNLYLPPAAFPNHADLPPNPFTRPRRRLGLLQTPAVKFAVAIITVALAMGVTTAGYPLFAVGTLFGLLTAVLIFA